MSVAMKVPLRLLTTGVPGLDDVLGGGLPEYSLTLVAGPPGAGKTTLVHQVAFANATEQRPAVYFTVVGEPALKMLRYQQQMNFFDSAKVGTAIRFVDLSPEVLSGDLAKVLDKIVRLVVDTKPAIVIVDSFRSVVRTIRGIGAAQLELHEFLQQLGMHLTSWEVTSFLIGEYAEREIQNNALATVTDGIVCLSRVRERNSVIRKIEVLKMRGRPALAGLHSFRISSDGISVFPRDVPAPSPVSKLASNQRSGFGIPALDEMMGGGSPAGDATLLGGPSGTGKTVLSTHFIAEGVRRGEPGVLAIFEERPEHYLDRAAEMGFALREMVTGGQLKILQLRPLDLSADETLDEMQRAVTEIGAKRLVVDSLNGLELALAPSFRDDFRESLYRMFARLTGNGVSILFTVELMESFTDIAFSRDSVSFLAQNIVFLRYVELAGHLRRMITVVKMRRSSHSHELRDYEITPSGLRVNSRFEGYQGLLTGIPRRHVDRPDGQRPGLTASEADLLARVRESPGITAAELEAELVRRQGGDTGKLARGLQRLLDLNYATMEVHGGVTRYHWVE